MRASTTIKRIFLACLSFTFLFSCTTDKLRPRLDGHYSIHLRWVKAYETETFAEVELGLQWSLSFLGAQLPRETWPAALQFVNEEIFILDLRQVGFSPTTLNRMKVILDRLKASDEYAQKGAVDLARLLVLSVHSSWHYYQLTQAPASLSLFLQQQNATVLDSFPILLSSIATAPRLIRFHASGPLTSRFFIAEEGENLLDVDQAAGHYEVLDIMPNGQLRFILYDSLGSLAPAAPLATTRAGKPSKCLWCHEVKVQPLFQPTPDLPGFINSQHFQGIVDSTNRLLDAYRSTLPTALDHGAKQAHTQSELLYIAFMEPSLARVAREWEMPVQEVEEILQDFPTHPFDEFPFLGQLYYRYWIDSLAPYRSERPPDSVREPGWEPDFFR